jgi:glyceraldehyde-3-phosphate dehydrogenase/erythrose-4-phosphate dehydrogenase
MNVMPTVWHLSIFAYTQLGMIGMAIRIPTVEVTVVLYHHIDSTQKGKTTINHSRFLVMRQKMMIQKAFMTIVEQTANPKRFQDVLYVFRVGRGRRREGVSRPVQLRAD